MTPGQSLTDITSKVLCGLEAVITAERPDMLLCHGDTTTSLAAALAAFYQKVPVGHVEAGLRTHNRYSPYPEELNRTLTGHIAALHFAPTAHNRANLLREGITEGVFVTGNTVIDAIAHTASPGYVFRSPELRRAAEGQGPLALLTAHRRENLGRPLQNICRAVLALAARFPELTIICPVHPSEAVGKTIRSLLGGTGNILLTAPIDVLELHQLLARVRCVLTDSGGLHEEAPALGKPVLVLRKDTERPEAIAAGTCLLAGVEEEDITALTCRLMLDPELYGRMAAAPNPYGDGRASERIVGALLWHFGRRPAPPEDFAP
jgi:UDP-N-acetylglucosamine 2-epimerase